MKTETYLISIAENGQKIYYFLKNRGYSERNISRLRQKGMLELNGISANMRNVLQAGDILKVQPAEKRKTEIAFCDDDLDIIFEDEDFLVVNKPALLACTPSRSHYSQNLGGQICKHMANNENFVLRILNRLDRETSGIVVVAKSALSCKTKIEKEYHALAEGKIEKKMTIDAPIETVIGSDGINERKRIISENGKRAITHIKPIKIFENKNVNETKISEKEQSNNENRQKIQTYTLISAKIETGRTHQIRVHTSSIGHALLGDMIYVSSETPSKNESVCENLVKAKSEENDEIAPQTQTKHAMLILKKVSFVHFRTKKKVDLEIPYPEDWEPYIN